MIQVMDLVGGNINSNAATFNKEAIEAKGVKVFDYKEFTLNGYSAKYVHMQGNTASKAYDLVFGDETFSTMVMAYYSADDTITPKQLKEALFSVTYDKTLKTDPMANAPFQLNDRDSRFRFFKSTANMFIYTIGGVEDKPNESTPVVLVTPLPYESSMTPETVANMILAGFERQGLTDKQIRNKSTEKINGYITLEEEVYGKMQDKSSLVYMLIVANKDKAVAIQGIATSDFENNIAEFKKRAHTVKLK